MECFQLHILILVIASPILKIHTLNCDEIPDHYWCISEESAALCELQEYCEKLHRNTEPNTDVERVEDALPALVTKLLGNVTVPPLHATALVEFHLSKLRKLILDAIQTMPKSFQKPETNGTESNSQLDNLESIMPLEIPLKNPSDETTTVSPHGGFDTILMNMAKQDVEFRNARVVPQDSRQNFSNTVIIVTSATGILASRWNTTTALDDYTQNTIHVYYHCPECKAGDYLTLIDNTFPNTHRNHFYHQITNIGAIVNTGLIALAYTHVPPQNRTSAMVFPRYHVDIDRNGKNMKSAVSINSSNWMERLRPSLDNLTIADLFIPGTHQSGAYLQFESDKSWSMKYFTARWIICQTATILEQLYNGIRYLDIRASCVKHDNKCQYYYVHHGGIEVIPMQIVVDEVIDFLDRTQEIVILSFKEFTTGFDNDEDHRIFVEYLKSHFGARIFLSPRPQWNLPLSTFWSANTRLLISYDYEHYEYDPFGLHIRQQWCNTKSLVKLHECLDEFNNRQSHPGEPSVDMVQLTHDWRSIVYEMLNVRAGHSLRGWANQLSLYITKWYYEEWSSTANIIAVDFFEITGIAELAIHLNERRARQPRSSVQEAPLVPHFSDGIVGP